MSERPRVGFLGVGWIGRHRMEAMVNTGAIEVAAVADPDGDSRAAALELAPNAATVDSIEELLTQDLDGLVIASPSALHAEQSIRALEAGVSVFCQKPLGRTAAEVGQVVEAACKADRLLGVDLSYRQTAGMQAIRELVWRGELGRVFAADLTFHNAYGPDKSWFYDPAQSGGGCVMDLGVHLVDLGLWALGWPAVKDVQAQLMHGGAPLTDPSCNCEDYAVATITTEDGAVLRIACSWRLRADREAVIAADFYGTDGAAALRNVDGSFYAMDSLRMHGTWAEPLTDREDDWGGRAAADWARRLGAGERFDPESARLVDVARVLDRIYGR
ncbi:Gfo/Idh/MocA family oxidoreductase [Sphingomonas sp. BN140010]|uniref:Gfo/Idh/MocA family oxidoreductase n=1 Tax=Sphingomonas arvum TaxID=2992113 RepID=A0ABT3JBY0_9SPHN|nr:Gfo/Idh/MocA family oxidoreductase [Sphingomonas sp. BN140010]MCW3796577.1 Gfo/Idh/MocA family oxidoreductase [Sphingomonas sp. BN140010]